MFIEHFDQCESELLKLESQSLGLVLTSVLRMEKIA